MASGPVKLNERLHLTIPLYRDADGADVVYAWVHSTPISREVFEAHFMLLSQAFTEIHASGLGEIAGPRVAALLLKKVAQRTRDQDGERALMNEVRRLTNVMLRTDKGWDSLPFEDAAQHIDPDDMSEVENAIAFFITVSALHKRQMLKETLPGAARLWGAETTSFDFTAFAASLRTSTVAANTGAKKLVSSVPH